MTKKKILIVDDESYIIDAMRARLEFLGYEVLDANDGVAGLNRARTENPDLIILDIIMPKMHGFEVCRKLKEDPKTEKIPIIIITGAGLEDVAKNEPDIKAEAFISKPYDSKKFVELVGKIIEKGEKYGG